jgi:GGDEF domain-containing protein
VSKKIVNAGNASKDKGYDEELKNFSKKVFDKMESENVPSTPGNYKIYFQKTILEETNCDFRRYVSSLDLREEQEETERILSHEEKMDKIAKLSIDMMQNIKSTYSKNSYLIKFIEESSKKSKSLVTQNAITEFFGKLRKNVHQLHTSLKKDMITIKELYSQNVKIIKELEQHKIFDTNFQVYKKEYFLGRLKKELEISQEMKFKSYLMLIRLNKNTMNLLNTPSELETANKFFSKVLMNKFRKSDVLGHLGDGIFGVIFSNLNSAEVKKVAIKFSDILNHSSMYLNNNYVELHSVISITEITGDCYIQLTNKALNQLDLAYTKNSLYLIDEVN